MTEDQHILLWQIAMGMVEMHDFREYRFVTGEKISRERMIALGDLSDESFVFGISTADDSGRIYLTEVGKKLL